MARTFRALFSSTRDAVYCSRNLFEGEENVNAVERAFDIMVQPAPTRFYTTQFAGDMPAAVWWMKSLRYANPSQDDFRRVQENLIATVTQKRPASLPRFLLRRR